ncbi:pyridoxal-dependent decarboxylase domain-containing protein [Aspergillus campestris IBT 28561]|uniref:Pyridoxal-dependent decarboxylase domain-containing protein n=1 Tax=Aspergillus campestris (strain IBT 28561) TaxID=1392248 RepID=A0A2I1CSV7_ASPC2|nr:pyridoxal-dependent decarboxylase domain-containing protein [Aspergillus campestris IBT 28561]PKY00697.1 pyridoxal-dependent decarboxylase domain-containing protein [Aspergillus campestris IBT 28561]
MSSSNGVVNPHHVISSYFIGPRAENLPDFKNNLDTILDELEKAREAYHGSDGDFISQEVRDSATFNEIRVNFNAAVRKAAQLLGKHSIPFWHPRPFTTMTELKAGQQLCEMFGYNINPKKEDVPTAWGHITYDGTVANLESIWVARNLKFYPLSLYQAMKEDSLWFIADRFSVTTCVGEEKLFRDLSVWELLNLPPKVILGMADTLYQDFGITNKFLGKILTTYNIQTVGKDALERRFNIQKPRMYFHAKTSHYSWPKGGAIAGIGAGNMHGIELDLDGHIDIDDLQRELNRCLEERQPVYAVVAIMGSTEEGAADRLSSIIDLRKKFRTKGLSFLVHADAAWGGYFATMIPRKVMKEPYWGGGGYKAVKTVPSLALREDTLTDFLALKNADSITVDPHKAGYIPYPAGALTYRDGRMRFLVTWTSPYLTQGSLESIGVYGVEGSKPGAAAMATWLSNKTIGLNETGTADFLERPLSSLSAHYAAMHHAQTEKRFICIPFNRLPLEKLGYDSLSPEMNERRQAILEHIIRKDNDYISQNANIMTYIRELGSDLNINAFALNWYREDGTLNNDIEEANHLMRRVVNRLSITSVDQDPRKIPLYLTSTQFTPELYGKCALHFMKRLHLDQAPQDLWVLRNVVMSPFPTERDFIGQLMGYFQDIIKDEVVKGCWPRNKPGNDKVAFLLRGTDEVFLDFLACFHQATQRQQIIFSAELNPATKASYVKLKEENPEENITLVSVENIHLEDLVNRALKKENPTLKGSIGVKKYVPSPNYTLYGDNADKISTPGSISCDVTVTRVINSRPLNSANREPDYPPPNAALSASNVRLDRDLSAVVDEHLSEGLILTLTEFREVTMQPFPTTNGAIDLTTFFFSKGRKYSVKVYCDPNSASAAGPGLLEYLGSPIGQGTMELRDDVHIDVEGPNKDPFDHAPEPMEPWEKELDQIEAVLNGKRPSAV